MMILKLFQEIEQHMMIHKNSSRFGIKKSHIEIEADNQGIKRTVCGAKPFLIHLYLMNDSCHHDQKTNRVMGLWDNRGI